MNKQGVFFFLMLSLVGCSAPSVAVRPKPAASTSVTATEGDTQKSCPPTEENLFGRTMQWSYAKFVCLSTTFASCYKDCAIWQPACGRVEANQIVKFGAHCRPPLGAKSVLVVQGAHTEPGEAAVGRYAQELFVGEPVVVVCGTPLPRE